MVRERIGRAIFGWRPYDDWTIANEGTVGAYLIDDALRIQAPGLRGQGLPALEGIQALRRILAVPNGVVRLVGLSGTGKTRLAQALFDDRLGKDSLAPELAIYANISDGLNPQPVAVATDLVAKGHQQILVIDNCPPELHNRLSEICRKTESKLSLLTIEYDVREDQPEGTDVFELRPSSDDLIEAILLRRVNGLSRVNAQSVAKFASGNARVALALANTVESGESVASLKNAELFERLFRQRHEANSSLLRSAQACSLAYSFQGEDRSSGTESELSKLAAVVGKDVRSLHADIAELQRRDLIQKRGEWRALLPHAIANRLAAMALESILPEDLDHLFATAPPRLLKSISRRLGYLHTSDVAQELVRGWLADGGWIGRVEELNETGKAMLVNVAPVVPVSVLDAIERAVRRQTALGARLEGEEFRTLLLSLAFESELFDRSVALILDLIEFEKPGPFANQVRNTFSSLFHVYLSGTHATVEQRIRMIDGLLWSGSEQRRELGFAALDAMLTSSGISSFHRFDFGGRPRDFGYFRKTREDVLTWFKAALDLCATHDARDDNTSRKIRTLLTKHLRGLWADVEMFAEIDTICRQFHQRGFWPEGWRAIRSIRRFRQEPMPEDEDAKLRAIERALAPGSLVERVRAQVVHNSGDFYDDIDSQDYEAQLARRESALIELGEILAGNIEILDKLISDLVACNTRMTLSPFAKGLVDAGGDRRAIWERLVTSFNLSDPTTRSAEFMACYLSNLQSVDADLVEILLQETQNDPCLSEWFPFLQARVAVSTEGISRLKQSLVTGNVPADRFRGLAYSGRSLDDYAIWELTPLILSLKGGFQIALDIVWIRILSDRNEKRTLSPELLAAGRLVVEAFDFKQKSSHDAHSLGEVIQACLSGPEGVFAVERTMERLKTLHSNHEISFIEENEILGALLVAQPRATLSTLFTSESSKEDRTLYKLFGHYDLLGSPFDRVPPTLLLSWCDEDAAARYPLIASQISAFNKNHNSNERQWNSTALALLERAPDRIEVLKCYIDQFCPMSWSGSRAAIWEANAQLLDTLENHTDVSLAAFARGEHQRLRIVLDELKKEELETEKRANERFE